MSEDQIVLEVQERTVLGKQVKHLRRDGLVPAVIQDHGKPSLHVMAPQPQMLKAYQHAGKNHPVSLKYGKQAYLAMIRDVDIEPTKQQLRHIVFNAVNRNEKVTAEVPVRMRLDEGNEASPAERAGFVVLDGTTVVEVEALPDKLPDYLEFDGEKLVEVGDNATVEDLIVPEGVTVETEPGTMLATVYEPSALAAANEELAGSSETETNEEGDEAAEGTVATAEDEETTSEETKE